MELLEFRIVIRDEKRSSAYRQNRVPVDGDVRYGGLERRAIQLLSRWVEDDRARRDELELLGSFLYGVLFNGPVEAEFRTVYEEVAADQELGLRVVLHFLPEADELAKLPWEYLHRPSYEDGQRGFFFAAWDQLVLARHVPLKLPDPTVDTGRLRVLIVRSSPDDQVEVLADEVIKAIEKVRETAPEDIEVGRLDQPDKRSFAEAMKEHRPHVLHFFGHGSYDEEHGYLAFVRENGEAAWVTDQAFADFCQRTPPRLVFLHACEGAKSESYRGFFGVGLQLVQAAVPAVVAMKYPIANEAAEAFAVTFYRRLAEGLPIDVAVQMGRKELGQYLDEERNFCDRAFGTPVVYLQSRDYRTEHRIVSPRAEAEGGRDDEISAVSKGLDCPHPGCSGILNPKRNFCPKCRRRFTLCRNRKCGEAVTAEASFCDACGASMRDAPTVGLPPSGRESPFGSPKDAPASRSPGVGDPPARGLSDPRLQANADDE